MAVKKRVDDLLTSRKVSEEFAPEWLARSIQCIDLTTLAGELNIYIYIFISFIVMFWVSGDDCASNVDRLCAKAVNPLRNDVMRNLDLCYGQLTTGAVCVYPARVPDAVTGIINAGADIPIASVATGFPSGQTSLQVRLDEIRFAVQSGAREIDIVINRELALGQKWKGSCHI